MAAEVVDDDGVSLDQLARQSQSMGSTQRDIWIVLGAVLFVALCIFIWAVFFRRRGRKHRHSRRSSTAVPATEVEALPTDEHKSHGHRRRRKSRSSNLPLNPTLAETRGLPPVRKEAPPGP